MGHIGNADAAVDTSLQTSDLQTSWDGQVASYISRLQTGTPHCNTRDTVQPSISSTNHTNQNRFSARAILVKAWNKHFTIQYSDMEKKDPRPSRCPIRSAERQRSWQRFSIPADESNIRPLLVVPESLGPLSRRSRKRHLRVISEAAPQRRTFANPDA